MKIRIHLRFICVLQITKFWFNVEGQHIFNFLKGTDGYFTLCVYDRILHMEKTYVVLPYIDLTNRCNLLGSNIYKLYFNFKHNSDYCKYKLKF